MRQSETALIESATRRVVELRLARMRELAKKTTKESRGSTVRDVVTEHQYKVI